MVWPEVLIRILPGAANKPLAASRVGFPIIRSEKIRTVSSNFNQKFYSDFFVKKVDFPQNLAPNSDASGQHPDLTGLPVRVRTGTKNNYNFGF
jgi:hypothetical protein